MIILDTNVLSAAMQHVADPAVVAWLDGLASESVWTTSITVFEVRFGLESMPDGRRRRRLEEMFAGALREDLEDRVLAFDLAAAEAAGAIAARLRRTGRMIEIRDVQIGGIVLARKGTLATRNTRHFEGAGIPLVNPWQHG